MSAGIAALALTLALAAACLLRRRRRPRRGAYRLIAALAPLVCLRNAEE